MTRLPQPCETTVLARRKLTEFSNFRATRAPQRAPRASRFVRADDHCYSTVTSLRSPKHLLAGDSPPRQKGLVRTMALGFYFANEGFTPDKYATAIKQLDAAGAGAPKGRTFHVALESDGAIQVFDIWDSQEDFDAFGATLMPILAELDVEVKEPMVATVHNVIEG
jgi:hypothetical protein